MSSENPPKISNAEAYSIKAKKLWENIKATEEILKTTADTSEMRLVGRMLRRDKWALIDLKIENNVGLSNEERMMVEHRDSLEQERLAA